MHAANLVVACWDGKDNTAPVRLMDVTTQAIAARLNRAVPRVVKQAHDCYAEKMGSSYVHVGVNRWGDNDGMDKYETHYIYWGY